MKIAIIQGSPRTGAKSALVAHYLSEQLNQREGVEAHVIDVREYNAPNFDIDVDFPQKDALGELLQEADGLLLVAPEYNGGMPGATKNLLDFYRAQYQKKPMATCTVSAGPFGGLNALHAMRSWMSYVEAIISPTRLLVSNVSSLFDENGVPQDPIFNKNAPVFLEDFIWLTSKLA